ncbi:MAG TPA: SMP-30/gluconolactonase/LRE family protein [Tepidisphaeraceae bacterium]
MKKFLSFFLAATLSIPAFAQDKSEPLPLGPASILPTKPNELFNGWKLSPAGRAVGINSMPYKMVLSPDGQTLAAVCSGRFNGVALIDLKTEQTTQWIPLDRTFNGIIFSRDGKQLYVAGGNSDQLFIFNFDGHQLDPHFQTAHLDGEVVLFGKHPDSKNFLTGMAINPKTGLLYLCNEGKSQIWVVDPKNAKVIAKWHTEAGPYACVIGKDGRYLFVSNWGDRSVSALDIKTGEQAARVAVGIRPNEMALAPDGRLFVCCAGDNTVYSLSTTKPHEIDNNAHSANAPPPPADALEILASSLYPNSPEGSTPDAVAVSPDGKSLFVANADNNDVMIADIADHNASRVVGFVPVGWYPTAITSDGKKLFVANGKGLNSIPSWPPKTPSKKAVEGVQFDNALHNLTGSVLIIDPPTPEKLAEYTQQVRANSPYTPAELKKSPQLNDSCIPSRIGEDCPITHVLYIIKENRTYDQVYGDETDAAGHRLGNGEPKIAMFGQSVTPNQHQIARDYVLFDNFYVNSEVSEDGHNWCDLAIATDFRQRSWVTRYTKHGILPVTGDLAQTANGGIWDDCKRNGVSFMCYHEGAWAVPSANRGTWKDKGRDMNRVDSWIADLHKYEQPGNDMPQFQIMWIGENHTKGTMPGAFTPDACVASNDIAVGKVVQAATRSKYWPTMAIFIVEDDAQNGPDHVDAHRTAALVISPYCKRHYVDSTHYTQVSMLRTMELILGLPPLTQYDAAATPMFNAFTKTAIDTPYQVQTPTVNLYAKNTIHSFGAHASAKMDFDEPDEAPEDELNRVLWGATMGVNTPYPTPIHRAVFEN